MRHDALHDPLTGLANRALCRERLIHALARSYRDQGAACVLFIDLDGFKAINDLYGHAAGDALLIALGRRLVATVRPADTVARLGGDEFVVVCEDIDEHTAIALGHRLTEAIHEPLDVDGIEHRLSRLDRDRAGRGRPARPGRAAGRRRRRRLPREGRGARAGGGVRPAPARARARAAADRRGAGAGALARAAAARVPADRVAGGPRASSATRRCCAGTRRAA